MTYNPKIHHRRSFRLKGYDYSQAGLYFVTICCQNNVCRFGKIENGEMIFNHFGKIADNEWMKLPERYPNMFLDVYQIMPNHIHGIIALGDVGATLAVAQNAVAQNDTLGANRATVNWAGASPAPTIGDIVGAYKSMVANQCLEIFKLRNDCMGKLWQRDYWEHIIRNEKSYQTIVDYIINNPSNWVKDKFYTE
jgi:REP element-mobilizing transposase RayT